MNRIYTVKKLLISKIKSESPKDHILEIMSISATPDNLKLAVSIMNTSSNYDNVTWIEDNQGRIVNPDLEF